MPSVEYPSVPSVPASRLWALLWAVVFFIVFNVAVAVRYGGAEAFTRFRYHTSYEEVMTEVERIKEDSRPKIVFLGGSIMWGSGTPDPTATIPARFAAHIPENVAVYNLGMIGARPLDQYLLAFLLRGHANAFVMDYNYEFGLDVSQERLLTEPDSYVRLRQLLTENADLLSANAPAVRQCFQAFHLTPPAAGSAVEAQLQRLAERWIPLLRYKDRINDALFGQHPLLLAERMLRDGGDVLRGKISLASLLSPPEERIDQGPWKPSHSADESAYRDKVESTVFHNDTFLSCVTQAFSSYAAASRLPFFVYVAPTNPGLLPGFHGSVIHEKNIMTLLSLFPGIRAVSLDTGFLPAFSFADETHYTGAGNDAVARKILETFRGDLHALHLL